MNSISPNLNIMIKAAEKASKILIRDFGELEKLQVSSKGPSDFVTNSDKKVEKILIEELTKSRNKFSIISEEIGEVKIIAYKKPLLDKDNLSGETKTAEEIVALPTRSVASVAATTAGIYQRDEGDAVNVRGSRGNATTYYVDGIKVRGNMGVPTSGIEQITVVTGGLPAKYGDATGVIISVTTKGPSNKMFGGIEYESSSLFDDYNYNLLGFALSGPILKKRNTDGTQGSSVIGYFLSGELRSVDDNDPSAIGMWKVNDDVLADLT